MSKTEGTQDPICPHCSAEFDGNVLPGIYEEVEEKRGIVICTGCRQSFFVEREVIVCYNTRKYA